MDEFVKVLGRLNTTVFTIFLVLKLIGLLPWSWWWVLAPIWGSLPVGFVLGTFSYILTDWAKMVKERKKYAPQV